MKQTGKEKLSLQTKLTNLQPTNSILIKFYIRNNFLLIKFSKSFNFRPSCYFQDSFHWYRNSTSFRYRSRSNTMGSVFLNINTRFSILSKVKQCKDWTLVAWTKAIKVTNFKVKSFKLINFTGESFCKNEKNHRNIPSATIFWFTWSKIMYSFHEPNNRNITANGNAIKLYTKCR